MKATKTFLLREIPEDLHRKIKVRAVQEGKPMNAWILDACRRALQEERGKDREEEISLLEKGEEENGW